jgi:hypothetical protein
MLLLLVIQTLVLSATPHICFFNQVDDILEPKLDRKFKIITERDIGCHRIAEMVVQKGIIVTGLSRSHNLI